MNGVHSKYISAFFFPAPPFLLRVKTSGNFFGLLQENPKSEIFENFVLKCIQTVK